MTRRDVLIAMVWSAVLAALLLPLARIGIDPHHDGVMLKPALDVLSGQVLFRDSFMQYGAVSCYLQAMALAIHRTLLAVRILTVVTMVAVLFISYAAWRLILPRSLASVACLLFVLYVPAYERDPWNHEYWLLLPWSSEFAMMFQAVGLYALCRVIRGEQPERWAVVVGMATAAVFWCRQPVGGMMIGCLIVVWPALRWTGWTPAASSPRIILGRMVGGFLIVNGFLLGGIALTGALPAWWYQNVIWPARWSQSIKWGDTLWLFVHPQACAGLLGLWLALAAPAWARRFRPDLPRSMIAIYFLCLGAGLIWQRQWVLEVVAIRDGGWSGLLPLIIIVQAALSIRQALVTRDAPKPTEYYLVAATAAIALGSLLQFYPVADSWHMYDALAPFLGLCVYAFWRWTGWPAARVAIGLTAALLPAIWGRAMAIGPAVHRPLVTLEQPEVLRGMRVPPEQAHSFGLIADAINRITRLQPDLPSTLIGDHALYLCFGKNMENPTPYFVTWRGLASQPVNLQRWQYIHDVRPMLILQRARWEAVNEFYRGSRYVPVLWVPAEELEIAIPQELADRLGISIYGAVPGYRLGRAKVFP
ncbi:MAG TPA: hypothetical protein VL200_04130 [Lacunisphaera sp.]|jgi:hypothetical protein|nr:hypothetical protein [Lacunisphaera sp.]